MMNYLLPRLLAVYLLLVLSFSWQTTAAQTPTWQAATGVAVPQSNNLSQVLATAADANGNVYLAGTFTGTARFGSTTLTSAGGTDAFLAKWNGPTNTFLWVQRLGGTGNDRGEALTSNGTTLYLAGSFTGTTTLGTLSFVASGLNDTFVAKLTDTGSSAQVVWAQTVAAEPVRGTYVAGVAASGNNVYLTGNFNGTLNFGGSLLTSTGGSTDIYVAKLTDAGSSGTFSWMQRAGGSSTDAPYAIAVSGSSVYVAGYYLSALADFGGTTLSNSATPQTTDAFVTKLTDAGTTSAFTWTQRVSGSGDEALRSVVVRGSSVYLAGFYNSATAVVPGLPTLSGAGGYDALVAKLTDAGNTSSFAWAVRAGSSGNDGIFTLDVVGTAIFGAGSFNGTVTFGPNTLTSAGSDDVLLTKLTDAGSSASFTYALRGGGSGADGPAGVTVSGTTVYVAGLIAGAAAFGPVALPAAAGTPSGFVAALTDQTLLATSSHLNAALAFFPSPAHDHVTVRLAGSAVPAGPISLTLLDALGRPVRTATCTATGGEASHQLSLRGLAAGHYHVLVQAGKLRTSRALLVE